MQGHGIFTWPDGREFKGYYISDRKHGDGIFTWPDGRVFEGTWMNGKQDGIGKYTSKGVTRYGEWEEGKRVGWIDDETTLK